MSSGLYLPTLLGLGWSVVKTPVWSTKVQTAVNGKELRAAFWSRPRWKFTLTYEMLRADINADLQSLMGFYMQMQGQLDDFYYIDPTDSVAANVPIGTGNGVNTVFQLLHTIGNWQDRVLAATANVSVNGVVQSGTSYTLGVNETSANLSAPPSANMPVTWTGTYGFRCRFLQDSYDFENFMYQLWQLKKLEFMTIK